MTALITNTTAYMKEPLIAKTIEGFQLAFTIKKQKIILLMGLLKFQSKELGINQPALLHDLL